MTGHKALCPYLTVYPTLKRSEFAIANGGSVRRDPPYGFRFFFVFLDFIFFYPAFSLFFLCFCETCWAPNLALLLFWLPAFVQRFGIQGHWLYFPYGAN
jgi:hypothetical protein